MPIVPAVRTDRQDQLLAALYDTDPEIRAARPLAEVTEAVHRPGLPLVDLVRTLMTSYADRPAVGERARTLVTDPATGQASLELEPRFETITYGELWERAGALAAEWHSQQVKAGDFVGIIGTGSIDFTVVDLAVLRLGAVSVPLQTGATIANLTPIIAETEQRVLATSAAMLETAVECALAGTTVRRVIVFDYHPAVDTGVDAARTRLATAGITLEPLTELLDRGRETEAAPDFSAPIDDDHTALLLYTSGSTGTPKGAIYTDRMVANAWLDALPRYADLPRISLNYLPLSHMMGRIGLYTTFSAGGTAYFTASADMSTFFEDLELAGPTELILVPRVCDTLFQHYTNQLHHSGDAARVKAEMREHLLGGRVVWASTGSAPMSAEMSEFMDSLLGVPLRDVYGSTEAACVLQDSKVLRPWVHDVRLEDVPELGYFTTDTPHPRGELLVKTEYLFPGYYQRPDITAEVIDAEGYYHTGDIMARVGEDRYVYVDRRSNVLKLAQGEFVAVSRLEALFVASPLIRQIFVYGNSARSYLLAVVVPTQSDVPDLETALRASIRQLADEAGLNAYEIPRDFIIETEPFSTDNGLLSGVRKLIRPKLKARYGDQLERLYAELATAEAGELDALREAGSNQPALEAVQRAARAVLNLTGSVAPDTRFADIGGDSLSALTLSSLLQEIFEVDVPVNLVVSPATTLRDLAEHIEKTQQFGAARPTASTVHGAGATVVRAADLKLDTFIDPVILHARRQEPADAVRTVLLTGANGYLGRFLCLDWLERLAERDGTLICVVRGRDADAARARLTEVFDSGDPELLRRFHELAADHLEVLAGDLAQPDFGLDQPTWDRLTSTVDLIVHPAALVNHVLPYDQQFGPNVVGTAEVIRLALTDRIKPVTFLSTIAVLMADVSTTDEAADIRISSPERHLNDGYANGYGASKWAGEVLLREASERYGLPVAVFRSDLILAHSRYAGQVNVPDMFTRLLFSLVVTGIAPGSFYASHPERAHYDGLPVDFTAEAITTIGEQTGQGFSTYNTLNPHDDGISLDTIVDWLVEAGVSISRVPDYRAWFTRFEGKLRALPDQEKQHSLLPLLHAFQDPAPSVPGGAVPATEFETAVQDAKLDLPHLSAELIAKYVADLRLLNLLS
ncbi:carboxylic acid reductase [Kribbella sp. NPDC058245]|uniref:carboxylic acid reductase n=1 Tax=Kribbella sp. NPDC058245 TaxID=3346399 RepID=UPI0036EAC99E